MAFESVMNFFRPAAANTPADQLQQPQQAAHGQQLQAPTPGADPTKVTPDPTAQVSPLDTFAKVWEAPPKVEGAAPEFDPSNIFQLNQESMAQALAQVNFAGSITEDQITAITAGGEGAVKALGEMLNATARQTMGAATQASAKMIEKALTGASSAMDGKINSQVRQNQISSHLQEVAPIVNHPAAAPLIQGLQHQLAQQFPKASPAEIAQKVQDYMGAFAAVASGKPEAEAQAAKAAAGTDWEQFFKG
ncbi:hypothetical protein D3C87_725670 [compost metagenome]